jgi:hypothetical protein
VEPNLPSAIPLRVVLSATARVVAVVVVLMLAYAVIPVRSGTAARNAVLWAGLLALVVLGVAFASQVRRILSSRYPLVAGVEALVVVLTVFIIGFALTYLSLAGGDPGAFTQPLDKPAAVYFTVTVLSTVGFGDISAASTAARVVVTVQMLADLALIAVTLRVVFGIARRADARLREAPTS